MGDISDTFLLIYQFGANFHFLPSLKAFIQRFPNLTDAFIDKIVTLTDNCKHIRRVTLLPYHKVGSGKSAYLGRQAQNVYTVPSEEQMSTLRKRIAEQVNVLVH